MKAVTASPAGVVGHTSKAAAVHDHEARRHRLSEVRIEPADNKGFTVTHHFKERPGKGSTGSMYGDSKPPKKHVFANAKDLHAHLQKTFTSAPSGQGDEGQSAKGEMADVAEAE